MAEPRHRLVCFDLDGTVMLRPNSLQYLCRLNDAPEDTLTDIDERERTGEVDWIAADHERARLIAGLAVAVVGQNLDDELVAIPNLGLVLHTLRSRGILTVLITAGPIEVGQAFAKRFPFDHCFGSDFETSRGRDPLYTGRITRHLGSAGKVDCLRKVCRATQISLEQCAAVGDGDSDIALFKSVGTSIGIACSADTARFAQHELPGDDLSAILPLVL